MKCSPHSLSFNPSICALCVTEASIQWLGCLQVTFLQLLQLHRNLYGFSNLHGVCCWPQEGIRKGSKAGEAKACVRLILQSKARKGRTLSYEAACSVLLKICQSDIFPLPPRICMSILNSVGQLPRQNKQGNSQSSWK